MDMHRMVNAHYKHCGYKSCYVRSCEAYLFASQKNEADIKQELAKLADTDNNRYHTKLILERMRYAQHRLLDIVEVDCSATIYNIEQHRRMKQRFAEYCNRYASLCIYSQTFIAMLGEEQQSA